MTRLVVVAPRDFAALHFLRDQHIEFEVSDDGSGADAILVAPRSESLLREIVRRAKHLRWIHTLSAGVESLPFDVLLQSNVIVTNSRGLYADALGEFAIAAMLWIAKGFRRLLRNQDARKWAPFDVEWLQGKTVAIIGFGGIGQAIGRRAQAMGMRVLPVSRREGNIDDVIPRSDYVILSTPLTPATHGLMSAARIARMRSSAVLINISRGPVVEETALVEALRSRRIRGAALDVFETEPLPPDHPLWSFDNVLVSPHSADHTPDAHERAMQFFLENLRRFERGDPLENIVDKEQQY